MREGQFKLVQADGSKPMLYDLSTDPLEAMDLLADGKSPEEAAIVASLEARFAQIRGQ